MKKRADGRYQKKVTINGKIHYIYAQTIKEIKDKEAELVKTLGIGNRHTTFKDAFDMFYASKSTLAKSTLRLYKCIYDNHLTAMGVIPLTALTHHDLNAVLRGMTAKGLSQNTVLRASKIANAVMNMAVRDDLIIRNPFIKADHITRPVTSRRALTRDEQLKILNAPTSRNKVLCMIMLLCGLRLGEALALTRDDFNYDAKTVTVNKQATFSRELKKPKTPNSVRTVPVPQILLDEIGRLHGDKFLNRDFYFDAQHAYFDKIGLASDITAHYLRHTYATILYEQGIDVRSAMYLLGHSDIQTTVNIYTHIANDKMEKESAKINEYFDTLFDTL